MTAGSRGDYITCRLTLPIVWI